MKKILIVDDDVALREAFKLLCDFMGGNECSSARSLEELETQKDTVLEQHLIILDISLGPNEPSGIEVYQWLVKNGFKGKIVFFTGHARSHPIISELKGISGVQILEKPSSIHAIEKLLREAL